MVPAKSDENLGSPASNLSDPIEQSHPSPPTDSADLPPVQAEPLSAIFLSYNDQASLEKTLGQWTNELNSLQRDYEILLVDDASADGWRELGQSLAAKFPRIRLIRHETRRSFGACLRTGLAAARFPLLLVSTCDGQYQPGDLQKFFKWIDKVHLVCGFRTVDGRRYSRTWTGGIYHWLIRIIFGLRLKDPECWFFLARRSMFTRIPIQSNGPFALAEILAKANFLTCLMAEVAVSYRQVPEAAAKWSAVTLRQKLAGFRRVFSYPDFGPANLTET